MSRHLRFRFLVLFFLSVGYGNCWAGELITAGWIEQAKLFPYNLLLKAKLDTGAKTTSISAPDLEITTRDNQRWAKFSVANEADEVITINAKVHRMSRIKRHFAPTQERPVIMMDICIGGVRKEVAVNLIDRSRFKYKLLIGRNFLSGDIVVDSGSTFSLSLSC